MSTTTAFLAGIVVGWILVAMAYPIFKHFKNRKLNKKRKEELLQQVLISNFVDECIIENEARRPITIEFITKD